MNKSATFRFSTEILKRLGEELNPNPDQGIIELVKNSYDADARWCRIKFVGTDEPGGYIHICDNGDGMSASDIVDKWLVLGRSEKDTKQLTRLGRIPAGSKGLGRLAALRLGEYVKLATRSRGSRTECTLHINWLDFKEAKVVESIPLRIAERTPREKGSGSGTEIIIGRLRSRIGRMDVKRLARSLLLLADPFGDNPVGFEPILETPEFVDLEALVKNRYFTEADYHLVATVDDSGSAAVSVFDWRGKELFSASHNSLALSRRGQKYNCPPLQFDLWAFILASSVFTGRTASLGEVRSWLQSFGGVHVYHNGLRVNPYGNPGNDWLEMNLRRARSPEERPSTNTSIGRILIRDTEGLLAQKTDRSGFIENEYFSEMRAFAQDALDWMARRRLEVAEQRRDQDRTIAPHRTARSRQSIAKVIEQTKGPTKDALKNAFEAYDRSREREVQELRKDVQLYRTLSTAGITAATFAHESSGNPIKVITQSALAIKRRGNKELGERYKAVIEKPVESILRSIDSLSVLSTATLRLLDHEKRRIGRVEVHGVIKSVLETFQPFLLGRNISIRTELTHGSPYLRGSEAALESIFTNLINNSVAAFERGNAEHRCILVRTELADKSTLIMRVSDNGPGIEAISKRDIWLPGQTTQPNGTGLGLTIVRDTARDLGGDVDAIEHGPLGGAELIIILPILGVA